MIGLILASGIGKRLRPITNSIPKSLIRVGSKSLIDYQVENLIHCGIESIIITTGAFEKKIRDHVLNRFPEMDFSFIYNDIYDSTNYIYYM